MNIPDAVAPGETGRGQAGPAGGGAAPPSPWLLVVCCVAQFMVILDLTIVNVALPSMQASLGFTAANLQWVVVAYAIVFAGFLMLGGRAADQLGQRRTLVFALLLFAITSLAGGLSVDQAMLVGARAVQGLSGALMAAASLAAITSTFAPGPSRHRAIGLWGAMNGAGGAAGALFGGIITQEWGWRWVLLINPPIGVAAALVAWRVVTDRPTKRGAKFDLLGALTLTGGLMITAWGFVNGSNYGWTTLYALGPIIVGFAATSLFPVVEARAKDPLVDLRLVTPALRKANLIVLLFSFSLFPMWYISSLYLQQVIGLSPLLAGLCFFPMAIMIMLSASQAGRLVGMFGVRAVLTGGLVLLGSGLLLLARIGPSGSSIGWVVLPGLLVSIGIGLSVVPSTIAATQAASHEQAGLASGLVNTSRQVGGSLGLALLISIATSITSGLIGHNTQVSPALTDGYRIGYLIAAGTTLAAALGAILLLPATGRPDSLRLRIRLPIAVLVVIGIFLAIDFGAAGNPGAPVGTFTTSGAYTFKSAPSLHPPVITHETKPVSSRLAPGYILLANFYDLTQTPMVGQSGPEIINNDLQPVWFRSVPVNVVASNLDEQTYHGKPVLSWWQGTITSTGATETGKYVIVNQHYQKIAVIKGVNNWVPTLHSMIIQGNDAWVTMNKNIPMNLSHFGGSVDGAIVDSAVQEYNIKTGKLVKSWDALQHIKIKDTYANPQDNGFPFDVYHVNSISPAGKGRLLVSMRNTWAAYLISEKTGKILWTLGGKNSSFKIPPSASFEWQHDVTISGNRVLMFDDNCCQITGAGTYLAPNGPSRGLELRINTATHTVTKVAQYQHGSDAAAYMGSMKILPNGNVFVGFGELPYFAEYSKTGKVLLSGEMPTPDLSYRANQVSSWVGLPLTKPSGAVRTSGSTTTVYASWNGATQVRSWRVLAGSGSGQLKVVTTHGKTGFETAIKVAAGNHVYQVEALNARGKVIGTSRTLRS